MPRHRFHTLIAIFATALLFSQCKKDGIVDSLTQFTYEMDYVVKIPASPITPFPVSIATPEINTQSNVAFNAHNTRADLVERVILKQLDLAVKTPSGGTLSFLKSVEIHAIAEGLPAVRVAYKDLVPSDVGATLSLDVTEVELREYFKKDKYVLRITVTTDEAVTEEYSINTHAAFFVDAKVLGQ